MSSSSSKKSSLSRLQPTVGDYDRTDIESRLRNGEEIIVVHPGTSQYSKGGISSCGLAAMNCVRMVLDLERSGTKQTALLHELMRREFIEDVTSISSLWSGTAHLELEEIHKTPFFAAALNLIYHEYHRPSESKIRQMLSHLDRPCKNPFTQKSCAVVITRPPEIIVCFKITYLSFNAYVIFDSHPRQKHPNGAAFIVNYSIEKTARYIADLLYVDQSILEDGVEWSAQLLGQMSGHVFEHSGRDLQMSKEATRLTLDLNLQLLAANAQMSDMKKVNGELEREKQRLRRELNSSGSANPTSKGKTIMRNGFSDVSATSREQSSSRSARGPPTARSKPTWDIRDSSSTSMSRTLSSGPNGSSWDADALASAGLDEDELRSLQLVARLQQQFDEEDAQLRSQESELKNIQQATFQCSVCMDDAPEDDIARIDGCGHALCRNCLRGYIQAKIEEHRYPIVCPMCAMDNKVKNPGLITAGLVEIIGIPEKSYAIFQELQLAEHSIIMHCRKCNESAFVDRREYQEARVVTCPLPACRMQWCKQCQQDVPFSGPEHSCDGTSELQHVMAEHGWRHCPGCQTPTEKTEGCNHMTCGSPGCNMHFCYVCGQAIIQSALLSEIRPALSAHFAHCRLY